MAEHVLHARGDLGCQPLFLGLVGDGVAGDEHLNRGAAIPPPPPPSIMLRGFLRMATSSAPASPTIICVAELTRPL